MLNKKNTMFLIILSFLFNLTAFTYAQEKPTEKKEHKMMMQQDDMQKCMDKIASDKQMRGMMMQKMMDHAKNDSTGMMQMCKMMMDNPEMHKMMMKMMQGEAMMKQDMMGDSTKTKNKPDHESHH